MASIDSVQSGSSGLAPSTSGSASHSSAELAKRESQLADWVHCPSGKTAAGKAKIAEITSQIDDIKAHMKKAEEAKDIASSDTHAQAVKAAATMRFDGLGTWLNAQA